MQKKRGISLIVLVITIIVMIILAAAIILSLNNAGIIGNANKAVDETNIANVKSAADLVYADYLITGIGDKTEEDLGTEITQKLINNNTIKGNDYYIKVFEGETYVIKEGSLADKYYDKTLKIGDYVDYDASVEEKVFITCGDDDRYCAETEVSIKANSDIEWRVLGIEGNRLLLTSSSTISVEETGNLGSRGTNNGQLGLYGPEDYLKLEEKINEACSIYGKGKYALSSRSITVEDVDRITQYKKENYIGGGLGSAPSESNVVFKIPYGTTLRYDGSVTDEFEEVPTTSWAKLNLNIVAYPDLNGEDYFTEKANSFTHTYYEYTSNDIADENVVSLIFKEGKTNNNLRYFLASKYTRLNDGFIHFGVRVVNYGSISGEYLFLGGRTGVDYVREDENIKSHSWAYVRPVVLLKENVYGDYNQENEIWNLN